jgi:hypothetical protein
MLQPRYIASNPVEGFAPSGFVVSIYDIDGSRGFEQGTIILQTLPCQDYYNACHRGIRTVESLNARQPLRSASSSDVPLYPTVSASAERGAAQCRHCGAIVEFYKGQWWLKDDFQCADGEHSHEPEG